MVVVVVIIVVAAAAAAVVVVVVDNFCIALFSSVDKLTALHNILQHFLSEKKQKHEGIMFKAVIHICQLTLYIHTKNSSLVVVG